MSALSFMGGGGAGGPVSSAGSGAASGAMLGGPWGAIIGGGLGLGNYFLHDKPEAEKNRNIQIARELGSPWTKIHGVGVDNPNLLGGAMQGIGSGIGMQQNMQAADDQAAINKALKERLTSEPVSPKEAANEEMRRQALIPRSGPYSGIGA